MGNLPLPQFTVPWRFIEVLLNAPSTTMAIKATQKRMSQKYYSLQPSNSASTQNQQRRLLGVMIQDPSAGEPSEKRLQNVFNSRANSLCDTPWNASFEASLATVGRRYSTFGRLLVYLRWLLVHFRWLLVQHQRQVLVWLTHKLFRSIMVTHVFLLPPTDQEWAQADLPACLCKWDCLKDFQPCPLVHQTVGHLGL